MHLMCTCQRSSNLTATMVSFGQLRYSAAPLLGSLFWLHSSLLTTVAYRRDVMLFPLHWGHNRVRNAKTSRRYVIVGSLAQSTPSIVLGAYKRTATIKLDYIHCVVFKVLNFLCRFLRLNSVINSQHSINPNLV